MAGDYTDEVPQPPDDLPPVDLSAAERVWYRKKSLVQAVQWTGENLRDVIAFTGRHESARDWTWEHFEQVVAAEGLKIFTLEGPLNAAVGDWILKGIKGECWPVRGDIFAETYEVAVPRLASGGGAEPAKHFWVVCRECGYDGYQDGVRAADQPIRTVVCLECPRPAPSEGREPIEADLVAYRDRLRERVGPDEFDRLATLGRELMQPVVGSEGKGAETGWMTMNAQEADDVAWVKESRAGRWYHEAVAQRSRADATERKAAADHEQCAVNASTALRLGLERNELRAALTAAEAERDKRIPWEDFQEVTRQHNLAVANAAKWQSQRDEAVTLAGEAIGVAEYLHTFKGWEFSIDQLMETEARLERLAEMPTRLAKLTKEGT